MATRPPPPVPISIPQSSVRPAPPAPAASHHHGSASHYQGAAPAAAGGSGTASGSGSKAGGSGSGHKSSSSTTGPSKPIRVGQYELGQTLGVGSFGKVKLATHSITGHRVAMKIINKKKIQNMDMTSRVKREIQYLKVLRHPHIIKLYEVITTPTDIIMVIEYAGYELFNYIVERGKMDEQEARRFFQQIICAVEYCHRHKIVHRDLKPENLLLDDRLNVKIADFGLSNIMTDGDFLKTSCGSPNYAAPEVISGKLYAGPEIDIWSCGVILYVMLCGRLPFDDEYIPNLFKKINSGNYHLPSHLSEPARDLLKRMLVVDPVRRITISEIRQLPWFQQDLPHYLQPLPSTPSVERPGSISKNDMSAILAAQANGADPDSDDTPQKIAESRGLTYTADLGLIELDIVDELADKMAGFTRSDVWDALKREGDNQIKVAYQLVRDHRRMLHDSEQIYDEADQQVMESFLASSPPPWNAGMESQNVQRSTSIKKRPTTRQRRDDLEASWSEEDEDRGIEDIEGGGFEVLETSLPGRIDEHGEAVGIFDVPAFAPHSMRSEEGMHQPPPRPTPSKPAKQSKLKWHFGIRSHSAPMEIMHEIYKILQVLGWQWKKKSCYEGPWDEDGRPLKPRSDGEKSKEQRQKEKQSEEKQNQSLFLVETRCKIGDTVVRMDIQLYRINEHDNLVDFRNVGYYHTDPDAPGFERTRRDSEQDEDTNDPSQQLIPGSDHFDQTGGNRSGKQVPPNGLVGDVGASGIDLDLRQNDIPPLTGPTTSTNSTGSADDQAGRIKEVCSPFLFLEAACRLIVELASG